MQVTTHNFEVFNRPRYTDGKFNRRTFDPVNDLSHRTTLRQLRQIGNARAQYYFYSVDKGYYGQHFDPTHFGCCASYAMKNLYHYDFEEIHVRKPGAETYLDVGAGESPDVLIARKMGYDAYSVDLFPSTNHSPLRNSYVCADALELPFQDCSFDYVSSQAMIALVPGDERPAFYREVRRVLKTGGTFSLTGANLKCGYGFKQGCEVRRARLLDWEVASMENGFTAQRQG